MFHRLIKTAIAEVFTEATAAAHAAAFAAVSFLPVICLCVSCAFADLRPIKLSTVPEGPGALLPETESPVIVRFDTAMEKLPVENALQISSPGGVIDGAKKWEGNNLHFYPSVPWKAGLRYGLKLSGTVNALDGRELLLAVDIPFYAVSRSSLPYLVSFSPPDEASVGVSGSGILELTFSCPMDRKSTEDALKLDIPGEKIFGWLDDDTRFRIGSDLPLNPWIVYRWSVSEKALSREGAPLAREAFGRFVTDLDREFLKVLRVLPLMPPESSVTTPSGSGVWGSWLPAGLSMEQGLGPGHGIGVELSKPTESDSLRRAFSFTPSISGRVEILSPVSAVFIPSRDPEPDLIYTLRVSGTLRDSEGLKMGDDYTVNFRADIPFLSVNSISFFDGNENEAPMPGDTFSVPVDFNGIMRCIINFSLKFDSENSAARQDCVYRISLLPFFPKTLAPVSLRSARWITPTRLLLEWEGPEKGTPGESHYYKLLIPGGASGAHNGLGSYFKEDFILYLEAAS